MKKIILSAVTAISVFLASAGSTPPIRLAYNYCTLSYTFAYYGESEWSGEIERLAKAGYNVALVTDGTFKVWEIVLRELGYSDEDILRFIPDECARAWWLMDNLTGEGGPLDQRTIDEDGRLGRFICDKMRARGIEPILQGYFGMMPLGHPSAIPQGKWSCYERPPIIDPTSPEYAKIAAVWHHALEKVYGFKPKYLAGDLFHEGGKTDGIDVTAAVRSVQSAQQSAFPGTVWVVQAWQANPTAAVRAGLDPRFTLIEALVKDMGAFAKDDSTCNLEYGDIPWIWCEVLNFGGNHGLYGNLRTFARLGRAAKGRGAKTFRGYGSLSEGFFTNPVCYDLFEEMMMRPAGSEMTDAELASWLKDWVLRRYGTSNQKLQEAWRILAETAYNCQRCQEGTVENVICAEPSWNANSVSTWGPKGGLWYDAAKLERAAVLLKAASANPKLRGNRHFEHDRHDVMRQVVANRLRALVPQLKDDDSAREKFLRTAEHLCNLKATPPEFRLATWEEMARRRAGERGAMALHRMITTWADEKYGKTTLSNYANREYVELVREWYLPRWKKFLDPEGKKFPIKH